MNVRVSVGPPRAHAMFLVAGMPVPEHTVFRALSHMGSQLHAPPSKMAWHVVPDSIAARMPQHDGHQLVGLTHVLHHWMTRSQQQTFVGLVHDTSLPPPRVRGHGDPNAMNVLMIPRILIVTFNQGAWKQPHAQTTDRVRDFLVQHTRVQHTCNLVVLATQEADGLLPGVFAAILATQGFAAVVTHTLSQGMLGSLQLHVWSRTGAFDRVSVRVQDDLRCGLLSKKTIAKGAVYAQLTCSPIDSTLPSYSFTVASLHLPSNASSSDLRNKCLVRIVEQIAKSTITGVTGPTFLMGDLNYRTNTIQTITDEAERARVRATTCNAPITTAPPDQLDVALVKDSALTATGLREIAPRTFCPTCRLVETPEVTTAALAPATRTFDDRRYPSWCDRILVRDDSSPQNKTPSVLRYDSWELTTESDHNAVFAIVELGGKGQT
jgi:hypothetical protein